MALKEIGLFLGWLLASLLAIYLGFLLALSQNLFSWNPELDASVAWVLVGLAVCLPLIYFLSGRMTSRIPRRIAFTLSIGSVLIAALYLYEGFSEQLSGGVLGRSARAPAAFHLAVAAILASPFLAMLVARYRQQQRSGTS